MYGFFCTKFSTLFPRSKPVRGCPKKSTLNIYAISLQNTFVGWITYFDKFVRLRYRTVLKMNSFTDSFQEFCVDFKLRYIPFWGFQSSHFTRCLSITACDSSARCLCNGLCNVILHVQRNCLQTLRTESSNTFINDIPLKIMEHHQWGLILNAFNFYFGQS